MRSYAYHHGDEIGLVRTVLGAEYNTEDLIVPQHHPHAPFFIVLVNATGSLHVCSNHHYNPYDISFPYGYMGVVLVFTSLAASSLITVAISICRFANVQYSSETIDMDDKFVGASTSYPCSVGYGISMRGLFWSHYHSVSCHCPEVISEFNNNNSAISGAGGDDTAWLFGLAMGLSTAIAGWVVWLIIFMASCCRRSKIPPSVFGVVFGLLGLTSMLTLVGLSSDAVCRASYRFDRWNNTDTAIRVGLSDMVNGTTTNATTVQYCTIGPGAGLAIAAGGLYLCASALAFRLKNDAFTEDFAEKSKEPSSIQF
jgi:hypothetical protein